MTDTPPFLQEVLDYPDVDEPRLVYADWLEDQGDPRGEFIRAQCQLAQSDETDEEYYESLEVGDRLLAEYGGSWAEELAQDVKKSRFRRGFIEEVTVLASTIVKDDGALFDKAPIQWLRLNYVKGKGQQLADLPALSKLRGLDVGGIQIPEEDFVALFSSPHLTGLSRFKSYHYSTLCKFAEMQALVRSAAAHSLTYLGVADDESLKGLQAGDGLPKLETLKVQADSTFLFAHDLQELQVPALKTLLLNGVHCDAQSINHLGSIPWPKLEHLEFHCADEGRVIAKLIHEGAFENLKSLKISLHEDREHELYELFEDGKQLTHCEKLEVEIRGGNDFVIPFRGETRGDRKFGYIAKLAEAAHLQSLRRLKLTHLRRGDFKLLATSSHLQQLKELKLMHSALNAEDAEALLLSPMRETLRKLTFLSTDLDGECTKAIAQSTFPHLLSLNFGMAFGHVEAPAMATISHLLSLGAFEQLRKLGIDGASASGDQLVGLAQQASLPELRVLSFRNNHCTQASAKEILSSDAFPKLSQLRLAGSLRTKNIDKLNAKFDFKIKLDSEPDES